MAKAKSKSASKLVTRHEKVSLENGALHLVVVADTHSLPHERSPELIAGERPDRILHAGDIGDTSVLTDLAKIAPLSAVRGNIDTNDGVLPDALVLDIVDSSQNDESLFKVLLMHIAVYGPKIRADAAQLARAEGASIIVCGHSHVPFIGRDRGLTVFNPGSIGPRRFHLPIVFGVLDVKDRRVSMKHVDCETGQTWLP